MPQSPRLPRRAFIRTATAAGLAASAPFLLPSRLWSAEAKPSGQLTLGFIGVGTQGRGLMGGFLNRKECRVLAVCDVDTSRREHAKKRVEDHYAKQAGINYKGCTAYNDFRELLARQDIDAVVIATPDHWHALISIAAARAGKDIFCEKPNAVRQNRRIFQTGSMQRSSREFRTACELVRNGRIGKVSRVEVAIGGPGVPCNLPEEAAEPGLDWNLWLGPAPERPYNSTLSPRGVHTHFPNWRAFREYGGGMVTDWGAHHFDIAQWGLGMDESGPVEIFPADQPKATQGVRLVYANGVELLHVNSGFGVTFHGSEGVVKVNRGKFEFFLGGEQKAKSPADCEAVARDYLADAKVKLYASTSHAGDWIASIRSRQPPICDVEVGARTVSVCHLVNLAYYHGQKLQWNPAREQFTGGTGNPAWLDVSHRKPWQLS